MTSPPPAADPSGALDPSANEGQPLGGAQVIPRPASIWPGSPPPWIDLSPEARRMSLSRVREVFASAPEPLPSPLEASGVRASAVLAALYEDDEGVKVILTRRAQHMRSHRGEVSFPGGGEDPDDADLRATALREACEEVGLDPSGVEIIGELDHLQTIIGQSYIVPFVALLPGRPELVANPAEVEHILHVTLEQLLDPAIFSEERWGVPPLEFAVQFFQVPGDTIWGATGRMLRNLLGLLTETTWRDDVSPGWPTVRG